MKHEEFEKQMFSHVNQNCKMKAGVFDSDEIEAMVKDLEIKNPLEIFFAEEVTS